MEEAVKEQLRSLLIACIDRGRLMGRDAPDPTSTYRIALEKLEAIISPRPPDNMVEVVHDAIVYGNGMVCATKNGNTIAYLRHGDPNVCTDGRAYLRVRWLAPLPKPPEPMTVEGTAEIVR